MKRAIVYLTFLLVSIGVVAWAALGSAPQIGMQLPFVLRQASTPGTQETGNINISGTIIGGQHVGGGAGLTGVNADLLDGINSTAFLQSVPNPLVLTGSLALGAIIKGTNTSTATGSTGVLGEASGATGTVYGVYGTTASTNGRGVAGLATASTGVNYGGYFDSNSTSGYGVRAISAGTYGVYGQSTLASGSAYGGYFTTVSMNGAGVYGVASASTDLNYGVYGVTTSPLGSGVSGKGPNFGVRGDATANGSVAYGVVGIVTGDGSNYGVYGESTSTNGTGVIGYASAFSGVTEGVFGVSFSSSGRGVVGQSSDNIGVYGLATGTSGTNYGVYAESRSTTGRGINAVATASSGVNYGVRGATASSTGWGVYCSGDFGASGTKAFRIDHPFDPLGKYLLHYSAESPVPQNFYVGNVVTDSKGYAWVELPDYFAEINANFKYQLTVVDGPNSGEDDFVMVKVRRKIVGNRFQIRTSAPNTEVSWRVDADRNDLYVRNRKPKDVVEKEGEERGKYQHPELYGEGPERGMDYQPKEKTTRPKRP